MKSVFPFQYIYESTFFPNEKHQSVMSSPPTYIGSNSDQMEAMFPINGEGNDDQEEENKMNKGKKRESVSSDGEGSEVSFLS